MGRSSSSSSNSINGSSNKITSTTNTTTTTSNSSNSSRAVSLGRKDVVSILLSIGIGILIPPLYTVCTTAYTTTSTDPFANPVLEFIRFHSPTHKQHYNHDIINDDHVSKNGNDTLQKSSKTLNDHDNPHDEEGNDDHDDTITPPQLECNDENLSMYLHDQPVEGMHVLCILPHDDDKDDIIIEQDDYYYNDDDDDDDDDDNDDDNTKHPTPKSLLKIYHGASSQKITFHPIHTSTTTTNTNNNNHPNPPFLSIHTTLQTKLNLHPNHYTRKKRQPWSIFTHDGQLIYNAQEDVSQSSFAIHAYHEIKKSGIVLLMEGGSWLWPGVKEGFVRTVDLYSIMPRPIDTTSSSSSSSNSKYTKKKQSSKTINNPATSYQNQKKKVVQIKTLSLTPLILSIQDFIQKDECQHIITKSTPQIQYSQVSLMDHDQGKEAANWRTSQSTFLHSGHDPVLNDLEVRTASLVRIPSTHQEHTQVLRYGKGERYTSHLDWFDERFYQNDPGTLRLIDYGRKNRLATVFWYLTDVKEGGETIFPRHNKQPQPYDSGDCTQGLKVKPETGKVIIFYSLKANGDGDVYSLHGACPVLGSEDVKWAANKWVWNAPLSFIQ